MDYNLPTMTETSEVRARRRLVLIAITLATIPCYCIGFVALALVPSVSQLTPTVTETYTPGLTATGTLALPTISGTPIIFTETITNTPTPTATSTSTPTLTPTFTATNTFTQTPTLTPSITLTPSFTFLPPNTITPTITSFPATATASPTP